MHAAVACVLVYKVLWNCAKKKPCTKFFASPSSSVYIYLIVCAIVCKIHQIYFHLKLEIGKDIFLKSILQLWSIFQPFLGTYEPFTIFPLPLTSASSSKVKRVKYIVCHFFITVHFCCCGAAAARPQLLLSRFCVYFG